MPHIKAKRIESLLLLGLILFIPLNHISLPIFGSFYSLYILISMIILLLRNINNIYIFDSSSPLKYFLFLCIYQLISVIWSQKKPDSFGIVFGQICLYFLIYLFSLFTYSNKTKLLLERCFIIYSFVYFFYSIQFSESQIYTNRMIISFGQYGSIDPNEFCTYLIIPAAIALSFFFTSKSISIKTVLLALLFLYIYFSISAGSRGGTCAILCTFFVILFFESKNAFHLFIFIFAGIILVFVLSSFDFRVLFDETLLERFTYENSFESYGGGGGRFDIWEAYKGYFFAHPLALLFGVAPYGSVDVPYVAHNQFLQLLMDSGLIGLSLYLLFLYNLFKIAKKKDIYIIASFIGIHISLLSLSAYSWFKIVYLFYLLVLLSFDSPNDSDDEKSSLTQDSALT